MKPIIFKIISTIFILPVIIGVITLVKENVWEEMDNYIYKLALIFLIISPILILILMWFYK